VGRGEIRSSGAIRGRGTSGILPAPGERRGREPPPIRGPLPAGPAVAGLAVAGPGVAGPVPTAPVLGGPVLADAEVSRAEAAPRSRPPDPAMAGRDTSGTAQSRGRAGDFPVARGRAGTALSGRAGADTPGTFRFSGREAAAPGSLARIRPIRSPAREFPARSGRTRALDFLPAFITLMPASSNRMTVLSYSRSIDHAFDRMTVRYRCSAGVRHFSLHRTDV